MRDLLEAIPYAGTSFDPDGAKLRAVARAGRIALERHDQATVEMAASIEAETDRHEIQRTIDALPPEGGVIFLDALEPRVCGCGEPTGSRALDQCARCWDEPEEVK